MTDVNLFELGCKAVRRTFEASEDAGSIFNEAYDFVRTKIVSKLFNTETEPYILKQQTNIANQASYSLYKGDPTEAAHQLRREIYFDNMVPARTSNALDNAAKAGLKALEEHKPKDEVFRLSNEALYTTRLNEIAAQEATLNKEVKDLKKRMSE